MTRDGFLKDKMELNDWWCEKCQRSVDGRQVTYEEYHDTCGYPVIPIDFSSWEGFGRLLLASNMGKLKLMAVDIIYFIRLSLPFDSNFCDRFANAVAKYLGWEDV